MNIPIRNRRDGFAIFKDTRVKKEEMESYARLQVTITKEQLFVALAKVSAIRWETMCYLKGGVTNGEQSTTITVACMDQLTKAESLIADVFGTDAGILEPGHYSKEC